MGSLPEQGVIRHERRTLRSRSVVPVLEEGVQRFTGDLGERRPIEPLNRDVVTMLTKMITSRFPDVREASLDSLHSMVQSNLNGLSFKAIDTAITGITAHDNTSKRLLESLRKLLVDRLEKPPDKPLSPK